MHSFQELYNIISSGFIYGLFAVIASLFLTPLQYLKIQKQEFNKSYNDIIKYSFNNGGYKVFFLGLVPYAILNFIVNGSFGIFDYISQKITVHFNCVLLIIFIHALLGGIGESLCTCHVEIKEIIRNKRIDNIKKTRLSIFFILIILRNSMAWTGSVTIYELGIRNNFSQIQSILYSFILGVLFGILSTPLDVLITKNCASDKKEGLLYQLKDIFFNSDYNITFAGSLMRFIQIGVFSVVTVLTMIFMQ